MRTFRLAVLLAIGLSAAAALAVAEPVRFRSSQEALDQGIAAFNGGVYHIALPALEAVTGEGNELARLYQARIYGDNSGNYTDHGKAFRLYKQLADELRSIDPDFDERGPIAAKSLAALSVYMRSGVPVAGIAPDVDEADRDLRLAATYFADEDAQFELAKVWLRGEGPDNVYEREADGKVERGTHLLSELSRDGYAAAQAFLADLLWRGKFVTQDPVRALTLIDVAVANAPAHERVWIEDIYQNIYCNAGEGVRKQATGQVAEWHNRYKRQSVMRSDETVLGSLNASPLRTCANGEPVLPIAQKQPAVADAEPAPVQRGTEFEGSPVKTPFSARPAGMVAPGLGSGFGFAPNDR